MLLVSNMLIHGVFTKDGERGMNMDRKMAESILNDVIKKKAQLICANEELKLHTNGEALICDFVSKDIHIYQGIEMLAEVLGEELKGKEWDADYSMKYFKYSDIEVYQLIPLGDEDGEN